MAARYGGEEFAIILPDTDGPAAFRMAERLRKSLSERVVKFGDEQIRITGSCGVSATDLGYATPEALIHSADRRCTPPRRRVATARPWPEPRAADSPESPPSV
jgi:diguanylate cyclase (GGDEF)-like protein